jgi:simple sugar transport system permease protein
VSRLTRAAAGRGGNDAPQRGGARPSASRRARSGVRLRAVGENPAAVDAAGVSVRALRYRAGVVCGVLVGLSGVYLSIAQAAYFQPHMSAGKGFIALAALVFARRRSWPALGACRSFGFLDALSIRLQGVAPPVVGPAPAQAIEAPPYLLTLALLAGFIGKATPPRASGIPYVKEQ